MAECLDIGCGPRKPQGFDGIDLFPYPGVDYVHDLDSGGPWPIQDDRYTYLRASHVIEHLRDLRKFFAEAHRVARHDAVLRIETPHYSSRNSWADPTHVQHLSVSFCEPFLRGYLNPQFPCFKLVRRKIKFGGFLLTWPGQLLCWLLGPRKYEKHFAWMFPAHNIIVELRVIKEAAAQAVEIGEARVLSSASAKNGGITDNAQSAPDDAPDTTNR
jgi:SAM-dependent methyltransferase